MQILKILRIFCSILIVILLRLMIWYVNKILKLIEKIVNGTEYLISNMNI